MSEQNLKFENFFPRPLAFADKAHELEMLSKWNDAKVIWESSLEASTAEANKRIEALESEVAELTRDRDEWEDSTIAANSRFEIAENDVYKYQVETANMSLEIMQLQKNNHDLREALEASDDLLRKLPNSGEFYGLAIMENNQRVLSVTPAESLQAHDDLRKLCEKIYADLKHGTVSRDTMELLREALKEVK